MGKFSKDKRDIFYRKAKEEGWRARSAFKLLQINEEFNIFNGVTNVVDLCAAPGSWSQVLSLNIKGTEDREPKIVAVDLQKMAPINGVIQIQGDITKQSTVEQILGHSNGERAELVVSDGAPDVTGLHDLDEYIQAQLILAALNITTNILEKGGTFIAKIFRGKDVQYIYNQLQLFFKLVHIVKPRSSRNSSIESFIVCQDYTPPQGYTPNLSNPMMGIPISFDPSTMHGDNKALIPFVACGDLSGFDPETIYPLNDKEDKPYIKTLPNQLPISPPYEKAVELKRANHLNNI